MWWLVAIFIGGYLAYIAWQFAAGMLRFFYLIIRDALIGEPK